MYRSTQTATGRWNDRYHQKWDLSSVSSDFQLIATMNPCPCGYGLEDGICRCTYHEKKRYLKKLSGPILDRFDMVLCISKKDHNLQKAKQKEMVRNVQSDQKTDQNNHPKRKKFTKK